MIPQDPDASGYLYATKFDKQVVKAVVPCAGLPVVGDHDEGVDILPQCLHTFGSLSTNSLSSTV